MEKFYVGRVCDYKKPELVETGDNVRISDFCRISSACEIGSDCEIATGTYISGGDGNLNLRWAVIPVWPQVSEYG